MELDEKKEFKVITTTIGRPPELDDWEGYPCKVAVFKMDELRWILRGFLSILIRWNTLIVLVIAVGSEQLCSWLSLKTDLPLALISIGIVFPVSFGIQNTFGRRERVLLDLASLKASTVAIFSIVREWSRKEHGITERVKKILSEMLSDMSDYLVLKTDSRIVSIYKKYDELLVEFEKIRAPDDSVKSVSACMYNYLRGIMVDFERLRTMAEYRTPSTFQSFSWFWLSIFPAILAPYFASLADKWGFYAPLYSALICSLMVTTLYNIIKDMEDPFDGDGIDDFDTHILDEPKHFLSEEVGKSHPLHSEYENK